MRSPFSAGAVALATVALALTTAAQAAPLIPGALLGGAFGPNEMRQFSTTGAVLDSFPLLGMAGNLRGTALIGATVYVLDSIGLVYTLDMNTGIVTPQFIVTGITNPESLGNIGGNLLVGDFFGTVQTYSPIGSLLGSFTAPFAVTGLDSDGTNIFAAGYNFGIVNIYSAGGTLLSSFDSGTGLNHLSSAAYDSDTNTLWTGVTYNMANPAIHNYTQGGALIGSFNVGQNMANGLDYIPLIGQGAAPEPSAWALVIALSPLPLLMLRRGRGERATRAVKRFSRSVRLMLYQNFRGE